MKTHELFENRYYISAELSMMRPLHIGRGISLEPAATDLPVIKDGNGLPFIPGSSLKGVLRSTAERLLRSLAPPGKEKRWACDPIGDPCVDKDKKEEIVKKFKEDEKRSEELWKESCLICRLFGSPWLASRVYIKDLTLANGTDLFPLTLLRDGVAIDRDTGAAKKGAKFDYELVPAGAIFDLKIVLENVEDWEAGLISSILKLWEREGFALGGMTSRGLGWAKLFALEVKKVDRNILKEFILKGEKQSVEVEGLINIFAESLKGG